MRVGLVGFVAAFLAGAGENATRAQVFPLESAAARSLSGQFIVFHRALAGRTPDFSGDSRLVQLEPALLTVMCERVKQALGEDLGVSGQWRGKILLTLHTAQSAEDGIGFLAEHFKDGWVYRLDLPNPVQRTRLVRAVVQAVLLEQANRAAGARSAEIPLWLSEGLLRHLLVTRGMDVLLPPPLANENRLRLDRRVVESRRTNALALARLALGERPPLTLEELSWPKDDQLAGPDAERYQISAHLLVAELLRFEDGRECLRRTLAELPNYLNWQLAFLRGFQPHFTRQLDAEKWWALQTESVTGRDANGLWPLAESWAKFDQLLQVPVQVRRQKTEIPGASVVTMATVIGEWDFARQAPTLQHKLAELNSARLRMAAELLPLLDEYRRLLGDYLTRRDDRAAILSGQRGAVTNVRMLVRATLKQLELLEAQRQQLKPKPALPVAAAP